MDTTILIKCEEIIEVINFLNSNFGFLEVKKNENYINLLFDKHLEIMIYDVKTINDFTLNFLKDNNIKDSTLFYQLVDLKDYNFELKILPLNKFYSKKIFKNNVTEIFKIISKSLNLEIILNFYNKDFYLLKNGKLQLYLLDDTLDG